MRFGKQMVFDTIADLLADEYFTRMNTTDRRLLAISYGRTEAYELLAQRIGLNIDAVRDTMLAIIEARSGLPPRHRRRRASNQQWRGANQQWMT